MEYYLFDCAIRLLFQIPLYTRKSPLNGISFAALILSTTTSFSLMLWPEISNAKQSRGIARALLISRTQERTYERTRWLNSFHYRHILLLCLVEGPEYRRQIYRLLFAPDNISSHTLSGEDGQGRLILMGDWSAPTNSKYVILLRDTSTAPHLGRIRSMSRYHLSSDNLSIIVARKETLNLWKMCI